MLYVFFYSVASHSFLASTIWWPFDYFQIMSWFLTVLSPCFGFTIYTSDSGEMCAMKEVTLFSDDPKSKESAKQLGQVWFLKCASTYTMLLPQQQKRSVYLLLFSIQCVIYSFFLRKYRSWAAYNTQISYDTMAQKRYKLLPSIVIYLVFFDFWLGCYLSL